MIPEPQLDATLSMPTTGREFVARLAELPPLPHDADASADSTVSVLLEPDDAALDEFVARCLAQLRQVMDELQ